jgi:hypothetical protein
MNTIDHIYYINLDYRTDRRLQFEDWLQETNFPDEKVTRISAIQVPSRGHLGAAISHCEALKAFLNSPHKNCIIFEDDFVPINPKSFWTNFSLLKDAKIDYDLVMCSYNVLKCDDGPADFLKKVNESFTASGYLITREFAPKLLENFKEAAENIVKVENETHKKANIFCIDVHWMKLMPLSKWYCFYPRIGKQCASYSDIQGHYTDYNA